MNIDIDTLHWLAGLLEGEAYFGKGIPSYPNRRHISIQMTDEDIIARIADLFGNCYVFVPPAKSHWKPSYKFTLSGKRAVQLMKLIYPLMGERRQQKIDEALASYISPVRNKRAKLIDEQVREIKQRIAAKEKAQSIALDYGVTIFTIREISQGKIWRDVSLEVSNDTPFEVPQVEYDLKSIYWLAGLLEGEGSFCAPAPSQPTRPYINLAMTDKDIVARAAEIMGVGCSHIHSKDEKHKDYFFAHPRGARAVELMQRLHPLMGERRRQQIDHALENYTEITDGKGENHSQSKLTSTQVKEIKRRLADGEAIKLIALVYAVSYYTIQDIKRGKTWTHITTD